MLAHLHIFRKMATVASVSKLIVTSGAWQASALAAHVNTRNVLLFGHHSIEITGEITLVISSLVPIDYVPGILEKRVPHRPGHFALVQAEEAEGKLLLGGAWGAPVDGALFIWLVNSAEEVRQFVNKDPYVTTGLVTKFDIRPLVAIVGSWVTVAKK